MRMEWNFFVGAHFTFSLPLVEICVAERSKLKEFGTVVVLPQELKDYASMKNSGRTGLNLAKNAAKVSRAILNLEEDFLKQHGIDRVLLIEDQLLGSPRVNAETGLLYPSIRKSIRAIPERFDNPWNCIFLCIKPYHIFLGECYNRSKYRSSGMDRMSFKKQVVKFERSWISVIDDITDRLPNISMKIWRVDQTRKLQRSIEKGLLGASADFFRFVPDFEVTTLNEECAEIKELWTSDEIHESNRQFESDWRYLTIAYPDFLINPY